MEENQIVENNNLDTDNIEMSKDTSVDDIQEENNEETSTSENPTKDAKKVKKDKKDEQIEELTDKLKRSMAEFENFRKRTEKEKSAMFEIGAKSILEKILPIVDNFERGLKVKQDEELKDPFVEGMDKVYKQLVKVLEDVGVKPIDVVDKEFNPDFHNAVMHVEDENVGENIIIEELQKGYTFNDSVIRYSMVKVAN